MNMFFPSLDSVTMKTMPRPLSAHDYSQYHTIRSVLMFIMFLGGMPLTFAAHPSGAYQFKRSFRHIVWCLFMSCAYIAIPTIAFLVLNITHGLDVVAMATSFWEKNGMKSTDIAVQLLLSVFMVATILKVIFTLAISSDSVNEFMSICTKIDLISPSERQEIVKRSFRRMGFISLFFVPVAVGFGFTWFVMLDSEATQLGFKTRLGMSVAIGFMYLTLLFPLPPFAAVLLNTYGAESCTLTISKYRLSLETLEYNKDKDQLAKIVELGSDIIEMLDTVAGSTGVLMFDECAFCLIFSIVSLYLGCTIFFLKEIHNVYFALSLSLNNLVLAAIYIYRFLYLVTQGQRIEDEVKKTVHSLYLKMMEHAETLSSAEQFRLVLLRERLEAAATLRPRQIFKLNLKMSLSALATVVTYLIIILQFKTAEPNGNYSGSSNCSCG